MRNFVYVSVAMLLVVLAATARAGTVEWIYNGTSSTNNSWTRAASWDTGQVPTADNSVLLGTVITANRTLTLDQDWTIDNLTVLNGSTGTRIYTLSRGGSTDRTLTVLGDIYVGSGGANLNYSASSSYRNYVRLAIADNDAHAWTFDGATLVGALRGSGWTNASITKTGAGKLTMVGSVGDYAGVFTINAGDVLFNATHSGMGNFLMTPTGAGDMTFEGTGTLGLRAGASAQFLGTASGTVHVAPGTSIDRLKFGGDNATNTLSLGNYTRYDAEVDGTSPGLSDGLAVVGTLNLGAGGTSNALYISPPASGSLQKGYILAAASNSLTGTFNQVYYNNVLVPNPTAENAIGNTHNLVYGPNYIMLENPTTNNAKYWINPNQGDFTNTACWDTAPAYDNSDILIIPTTGGRCNMPAIAGGATQIYGDIILRGGDIYIADGGVSRATYRFVKNPAAGTTGSFIVDGPQATFNRQGSGRIDFDLLDGDFIVNYHTTSVNALNVLMRGTGVTYTNDGYTEDYNTVLKVTLDNGASVSFVPVGGGNTMRGFENWGTATGRIIVPYGTNERVQTLGSGDSSGLDVKLYPYANNWGSSDPRIGDGVFMQGRYDDVEFNAGAWNTPGGRYTAHLPGNLRCSTFQIGTVSSGSPNTGVVYTIETDNYDLTVDADLTLGQAGTTNEQTGILKVGTSTVDIGGNVLFRYVHDGAGETGYYGGSYITATTAQIAVGGNWTVDCATLSAYSGWDLGQSTVTFDGSGTQIVKAGDAVPFYNVVVNQTGSVLQLNDNLVVLGDLTFESDSTVSIPNELHGFVLKGGRDTFETAQVIDADNANLVTLSIVGASYSYVKLESALVLSDNLNIASGCKLYLNGFDLIAEGQPFYSATTGVEPWDQGEIIGTIPEPGTLLLLGTGLIGVLGILRRRRMR